MTHVERILQENYKRLEGTSEMWNSKKPNEQKTSAVRYIYFWNTHANARTVIIIQYLLIEFAYTLNFLISVEISSTTL